MGYWDEKRKYELVKQHQERIKSLNFISESHCGYCGKKSKKLVRCQGNHQTGFNNIGSTGICPSCIKKCPNCKRFYCLKHLSSHISPGKEAQKFISWIVIFLGFMFLSAGIGALNTFQPTPVPLIIGLGLTGFGFFLRMNSKCN